VVIRTGKWEYRQEECYNPGVLEVNGYEYGDIRTKVTVSYVDNCCKEQKICEKELCFCTPMSVTGCQNARGTKTCYTGTDILFRHNYVTSPAELR